VYKPLATTAPRVQRKCGCSTGGDCGCGGKKKVQRKARDPGAMQHEDAFEQDADRAADRALHGQRTSGGAPAFERERPFVESRLGHDFSGVRVNDDPAAHAEAASQRARAFTYGPDIYFGRGELTGAEGRWLLAHELAHTVQQGASSTVRRKEIGDSCTPENRTRMTEARDRAVLWLGEAVTKLGSFRSAPKDPSNARVARALQTHFHTVQEPYVSQLLTRLTELKGDLVSLRQASDASNPEFTMDCAPASDPGCIYPIYTNRSKQQIMFCPSAWNFRDWALSEKLVHEGAHAFINELSGANEDMVVDRSYRRMRLFRYLSPEESFGNADSYGGFVSDVWFGSDSSSTAPVDEVADCGGNKLAVNVAIARAERLHMDVMDRLRGMSSQDFAQTYQGHFPGAKKPSREEVLGVFGRLSTKFQTALDVECENDCDPGETGYFRHSPGISYALHVCQGFFRIPEERHAITMYGMLLQYSETLSTDEAAPYLAIAMSVGELPAATRLEIEDTRPKVLPADEASYQKVLALANKTQGAMGKVSSRTRHLVGRMVSLLSERDTVVRFLEPGNPPLYDSATNTLSIPRPDGTADGRLMLDLLREILRQEQDVDVSPLKFVTAESRAKTETAIVSAQTELIGVLVAAGILTDATAAAADVTAGSEREKQRTAGLPNIIEHRIDVAGNGTANLMIGTTPIPLGTLPIASRSRAEIATWVRTAVHTPLAQLELDVAKKLGYGRLLFRVYQYDLEIGEVEITP
jgi:hypothetical protein